MGDDDSTGERDADGGRRRTRRRRALLAAGWTMAGGLLLGSAGLGFLYYKLNGNISGVDINARLGTDRPADPAGGSMDILVMGSDSRAGENGRYGHDDGGARSDTAMIVHINADQDHATVVAIPRDTLISRPSCEKNDGTTVPGDSRSMFNEAYQAGGPACAVKTVESMTGIRVDHYVEVDFAGFTHLVDTLGGVEVTLTKPLKDPDSHLDLSAGPHTLDGEEALGLVRTRHAVGNGSDLGRIQLQQDFLRALMEQTGDIGLFSDPARLYDLADTATSALTTDSELDSVSDLVGLAKLMNGVEPGDVRMLTLPVEYAPDDPNRVIPVEHKTRQVWRALRQDQPVPESATRGTAGEESDGNVDVVR